LKIGLAILLVVCVHFEMSAQILIALVFGEKLQSEKLTFGLCLGPTFSTITAIDASQKRGLSFGLYFDIKLSQNLFLHPEIIPKSSLGAKSIPPYSTGIDSIDSFYANGSIKRNIRAMSFPLLCRYRIKGLLFAEAGPQIDWMLNTKDIYSTDVNGDEATYTISSKDEITRFDLGVAAGLHYKLKKDKGMGLGIRYLWGLTDMIKTQAGAQVNQALYLNFLIPVGTGKTATTSAASQ
jgi:hypothetical protein